MNFLLHQYNEVTSTNDIAIDLAKCGKPAGTVISAQSQIKGRGRRDNKWISPNGGLYLSLILKPEIEIKFISLFPIFFAETIIKFINNNYKLSAKLKWPNDIMLNNKKLGGILIQSEITHNNIDFLIVGMGINLNINPTDPYLKEKDITHLAHHMGQDINIDLFQKDLLDYIKYEYLQFISLSSDDKIKYILTNWNQVRESCDKIIVLRDSKELEGRIIQLNNYGTLKVEFSNGKIEDLISEETRLKY